MPSLVIYSNEFNGHLQNGLDPARFKYRFLAEGDSWMDRSAMFHTSLLQQLAPEMDAGGDDVQTTVAGWTSGRDNVFSVPTDGNWIPADPLSNASSGDCLNEIHLNQSGWKKLAKVWRTAIKAVI